MPVRSSLLPVKSEVPHIQHWNSRSCSRAVGFELFTYWSVDDDDEFGGIDLCDSLDLLRLT